eukprot:m.53174 g.53174  ORF g.53174 m.53174 type:complete len:379 (+) comp6742_c0_seq1:184-1320(+)
MEVEAASPIEPTPGGSAGPFEAAVDDAVPQAEAGSPLSPQDPAKSHAEADGPVSSPVIAPPNIFFHNMGLTPDPNDSERRPQIKVAPPLFRISLPKGARPLSLTREKRKRAASPTPSEESSKSRKAVAYGPSRPRSEQSTRSPVNVEFDATPQESPVVDEKPDITEGTNLGVPPISTEDAHRVTTLDSGSSRGSAVASSRASLSPEPSVDQEGEYDEEAEAVAAAPAATASPESVSSARSESEDNSVSKHNIEHTPGRVAVASSDLEGLVGRRVIHQFEGYPTVSRGMIVGWNAKHNFFSITFEDYFRDRFRPEEAVEILDENDTTIYNPKEFAAQLREKRRAERKERYEQRVLEERQRQSISMENVINGSRSRRRAG